MARAPQFDWYLVQWMESLNVNQAQLGKASGYDKAKMSNLVNGTQRYNRDIINDLSKALHLAPFELLMHPDDAMRIRRLREAAVSIAADNPREIIPEPKILPATGTDG